MLGSNPVSTTALAVRRSNHSAKSHPHSAIDLIRTKLGMETGGGLALGLIFPQSVWLRNALRLFYLIIYLQIGC